MMGKLRDPFDSEHCTVTCLGDESHQTRGAEAGMRATKDVVAK